MPGAGCQELLGFIIRKHTSERVPCPGNLRLTCAVILGGGGGGHYPLGQSYRYGERGTQPAGCWPKNGITAAAANPEILPLEFLLGDDPVHGSLSGWIAEW